MNVVLPFWSGDADQAKALLEWAIELDGSVPNTGILVFDDKTDGTEVAALALKYFKEVIQLRIDAPVDRTWPKPQNHYFQRASFQYALKQTINKTEWLWWETDAWPIRKGWLATIGTHYKEGKKPFMGPIVRPQGYMAGVAVYPGNVTNFLTDAMLVKHVPWDIVARKDVAGKVHDSSAIMQHEKNGDKFRSEADLLKVRPGVVLYHRVKDTSLRDMLKKSRTAPTEIISTPSAPAVKQAQARTCLLQLGRRGDIVNILPIAFDMWRKTGLKTPVVVQSEFASLLTGTGYCEAVIWNGDVNDVNGAIREISPRFEKVIVTKVNGTNRKTEQQLSSYCLDSWRLAGYEKQWGKLPWLFDRRNAARERLLAERIIGSKKDVVLFSGNGVSFPFRYAQEVLSYLKQRFTVIEMDPVKIDPLYDMLGLFERASCLVTCDSFPLHLAKASSIPVVAFLSDHSPWTTSIPPKNTVISVPYGQAMAQSQAVINAIRKAISERFKTPAGDISIRRYCAIGDVIMASGVAKKLSSKTRKVTLQCHQRVVPLFEGDPNISAVPYDPATGGLCDIDLDMSYEGDVHQFEQPTQVIMARKANLGDISNLAPVLAVNQEKKDMFLKQWGHLPRPWIAVCPRSENNKARTVPDTVWGQVPDDRTWIWLGMHVPPPGFINVHTADLQYLLAALSCVDVLVTVDSGPMHMAAAVGTPVIAITQSYRSDLQLTDQRDFRMVSRPDLTCLNCHETFCPIDRQNPPCGAVDPRVIRRAVDELLLAYSGDAITAVIPVYKPNVSRLAKCIEHALRYVPEIVASIDGDGQKPSELLSTGLLGDPRIKWVSNPTGQRRGYGKTCNFGARHANGRFLLFLNDDVYLQPGAVNKMKSAILPSQVGAVGCLLRYPDGTVQHGGTYRADGHASFGHLDWKKNEPSITSLCEVENVTHASVLIRREAFYDVLGYDEEYDCYWEDCDLNMKIRQKGWKIMYEPNARAIHEEHQTTKEAGSPNEFYEIGKKIFERKWKWYFDKNPANQLGTFV